MHENTEAANLALKFYGVLYSRIPIIVPVFVFEGRRQGGNLAVEKNIDQRKSILICQMPEQDYWHLATDISPETQ